ncbi:C-X-C motif chemokine 16 [Lepus europaeus]|uniref:C-X-C motif chemokine 16 n=1 Tax=Lepus europaeus TaxID=9983 RepID=UPI002B4A2B5A|nr:C-X-C motif chemokine 16 [Lepus europaeus]
MTGRRALLLLLLLLQLLAALAVSVGANQGSVTGSCHCDQRIPSSTPPKPELMEHFRKQLRAYHRCPAYIRFRLHSRSVCGGSRDPWVHELLRCFDGGECGHAHRESLAHRKPLPSRSTEIPKSTEEASAHLPSTAQTHLPTTLPPGAHGNETTTAPLSQSPEVGPEAGQNQKQLKEIVGPAAGTSATVPVLTLLAITFLLTGVLAYVLCKRRRERSLKCSPDLRLYYTRVA